MTTRFKHGLRTGLAWLARVSGGLILIVGVNSAYAHPLAPALLEMQQTGAQTWSVLWRHSRVQSSGLALQPRLPAACRQTGPASVNAEVGTAVAARWQINCVHEGLIGARIVIDNLERSPINVIVRLQDARGNSYQTLLAADQTQFVVPQFSHAGGVWSRYLRLGISHLLLGADHLLFLLALLLLVQGWRALAITLSAFTLGHSATLSLAALGWIHVNAALMEWCIAASLVVVARELLGTKRSFVGRRPALLAVAFGLLHGLGFAGALASIGLPEGAIAAALLAFNIGIEAGQLLVVAAAYFLAVVIKVLWRELPTPGRAFGTVAPAYVIGGFAMFWCLQRSGLGLIGS